MGMQDVERIDFDAIDLVGMGMHEVLRLHSDEPFLALDVLPFFVCYNKHSNLDLNVFLFNG